MSLYPLTVPHFDTCLQNREHVYAILRHNGVPLGKMDSIGALPTHDVR